jgi:hypothetical protein
MAVEGELRKIEFTMAEINRKLDAILEDRERLALMLISERSLKDFLSKEPDLYSMKDVKARY